jgi:toxin ParE1/3/4
MANYRLSNEAKEDLIRIHHYGVEKFGITLADKYFDAFFEYFDIIAQRPFSFESVDYIKKDIEDVFVGLTVYISE